MAADAGSQVSKGEREEDKYGSSGAECLKEAAASTDYLHSVDVEEPVMGWCVHEKEGEGELGRMDRTGEYVVVPGDQRGTGGRATERVRDTTGSSFLRGPCAGGCSGSTWSLCLCMCL